MKPASEILILTSKKFTKSLLRKIFNACVASNQWYLQTTTGRKILHQLLPEIFRNTEYGYQSGYVLPDGFYICISGKKNEDIKINHSIHPQKILGTFNYN